MSENFEKSLGQAPEIMRSKKLSKKQLERRLATGENPEKLNLTDFDLAGLDLEGKSFRKSDLRGAQFYWRGEGKDGSMIEARTNIKRADFTDATIGEFGPATLFVRVEAEEASFGFSEDLNSRRKRHLALKKAGKIPATQDSGQFLNFNASEGNFKKTKWKNINFGGGTGYEAILFGADLSGAEIAGCDLSEIDFASVKIDGLKIIDPSSLRGLKIEEEQVPALAAAIQLSNEKTAAEFSLEITAKGAAGALMDFFEVEIIK
jgi:uncharacterized protein YjbI with pentapeptide repeats